MALVNEPEPRTVIQHRHLGLDLRTELRVGDACDQSLQFRHSSHGRKPSGVHARFHNRARPHRAAAPTAVGDDRAETLRSLIEKGIVSVDRHDHPN